MPWPSRCKKAGNARSRGRSGVEIEEGRLIYGGIVLVPPSLSRSMLEFRKPLAHPLQLLVPFPSCCSILENIPPIVPLLFLPVARSNCNRSVASHRVRPYRRRSLFDIGFSNRTYTFCFRYIRNRNGIIAADISGSHSPFDYRSDDTYRLG